MKKLVAAIVAGVFLIASVGITFADTWVNSYTRRDGTYVSGHYRSDPNSTVTDNWSFKGNTNPYTGKVGTNRYTNSPSSPYFGRSSNGYRLNEFGRRSVLNYDPP